MTCSWLIICTGCSFLSYWKMFSLIFWMNVNLESTLKNYKGMILFCLEAIAKIIFVSLVSSNLWTRWGFLFSYLKNLESYLAHWHWTSCKTTDVADLNSRELVLLILHTKWNYGVAFLSEVDMTTTMTGTMILIQVIYSTDTWSSPFDTKTPFFTTNTKLSFWSCYTCKRNTSVVRI
jgi:hypothetical protein